MVDRTPNHGILPFEYFKIKYREVNLIRIFAQDKGKNNKEAARLTMLYSRKEERLTSREQWKASPFLSTEIAPSARGACDRRRIQPAQPRFCRSTTALCRREARARPANDRGITRGSRSGSLVKSLSNEFDR